MVILKQKLQSNLLLEQPKKYFFKVVIIFLFSKLGIYNNRYLRFFHGKENKFYKITLDTLCNDFLIDVAYF